MQDSLQMAAAAQEPRRDLIRQVGHAGIAVCQEGIRELRRVYVGFNSSF